MGSLGSGVSGSGKPPTPFWPDEFLRDDLPEARVWTYGYNANVFEGLFAPSNKHGVEQHGDDLAIRFGREVENEVWLPFFSSSPFSLRVSSHGHMFPNLYIFSPSNPLVMTVLTGFVRVVGSGDMGCAWPRGHRRQRCKDKHLLKHPTHLALMENVRGKVRLFF